MPNASPMPSRGCVARGLAGLLAAGLSLAVLAGFFGGAVHALDSAGHFRAHLSVVLAVVAPAAFLLRAWPTGLFAAAVAVLGLATTYPFLWPTAGAVVQAEAGGPRYTLLQMNLRYDADPAAALQRIAAAQPDIVTVQEGTQAWREAFRAIAGRYPYQFFCDGPSSVGDSGILSRRPFTQADEGLCLPEQGLAVRSVDLNGIPVTVGSLHLDWPWPRRQWRQIAVLETLPFDALQPLLLAGDFNAAPWSAAVGVIAEASDTAPIRGIGPTWLHRLLPKSLTPLVGLPIDNVLAPQDVVVLRSERMAPTGSDHLPILVTFTPKGSKPSRQEPDVQVVSR